MEISRKRTGWLKVSTMNRDIITKGDKNLIVPRAVALGASQCFPENVRRIEGFTSADGGLRNN